MNFRLLLTTVCVACLAAAKAHAQTDIWIVGSGNWSTGTNWSLGLPLNNGTILVEFANLSSTTSTVDTNYSVDGLLIEGTGPLTVNSSGGSTITNFATIADTSASPVTLNVGILGSGDGGIIVSNGGSLTLGAGGLSTYNGPTVVVSTGTSLSDSAPNAFSPNSSLEVDYGTINVNYNETALSLGDYILGSGVVNIASGATLTLNGGVTTSFTGAINGAGGLTKNGASTLILAGANTYTGPTSVGTGATIQIGNGGSTGSLASSGVSGQGEITFDRGDSIGSYSGNLTGSLTVVNSGSGVFTISGDNTYSGSTAIIAGTLGAGSNTAFSASSNVTLNGTAVLAVNSFSPTIGELNSNSTSTQVNLGTGNLTVTGSGTSNFLGSFTGTGGLTYNSYGDTLLLQGNNSAWSGTLTIDQGTVQIGNVNTSGTLGTGNIVFIANAGLTFGRTDATSYANNISGPGTVEVARGNVTLSGNNTYNGYTDVFQSTLNAGSTTAFGHLATLDVTTNGVVNLNNYSLTIGNLSGDSSATVNLGSGELSLGNFISGTTYAGVITGTGILNAQVISSITLTGNGNTYSGGTIVNSGVVVADNNNPADYATGTGSVTINNGGTLQIGAGDTNGYIANLPISNNGNINFQRTDAITFPNSITGSGGITAQDGGNITLSGTNVYSGETTISNATLTAGSTSAIGGTGESTVFITSGGTLNLNGFNTTVGAIESGSGATIALGAATLTTGGANNFEIYGGAIIGTGGVTFVGNSTTSFDSAIAYTGPTVISGAGTVLEVGFNNSATGSLASSGVSGSGDLDFSLSSTYTYGGNISGGIEVALLSGMTGTVTLSGNNSFTGSIVINDGTLKAGSATALGAASEVYFPLSQGVLDLTSFGATIGSLGGLAGSSVHLGSNNLTINGPGGTFAGTITGTTGSLTISGASNSTILDGVESYTGGTSVEPGATLSIGDNNATGAMLGGNVDVQGTLIFAPSATDNVTFGGAITDIGSVILSGAGNITFTGSGVSNYSGTTTLNSGTLSDGAANAFSPYSSMIVNQNGTLKVYFNESVGDIENGGAGGNVVIAPGATLTSNGQNNPGPFMGTISGGGTFAINSAAGSQGLAGANTFSGGTHVVAGELWVGSSTVGAPGSVTSGPVGTGTLTFESGSEMSPLTNVTLANAIVLNGSGDIDNDDGTFAMTLSGVISGTNGLEWCTWSNLNLTNSNSFQGGVDMREGYLFLGSDSAAGTGQIYLDSGTTLAVYGGPGTTRTVFNNIHAGGSTAQLGNSDNNFLVLDGTLGGAATITYLGGPTGTLTLSGDDSGYTGQLTIGSGTVIASSANALGGAGSNGVALTGNATLNLENNTTVTGPITFSGSGNTLSGTGTIDDSIASVGNVTVFASSSPTGGAGGTLTFQSGLVANPGLTIDFRLYNATGTAGSGWGVIDSGGIMNFSSATVGSLTFNLISINSAGGAANAINFNPATSYSWLVASSPGGVTGFNPNLFTFNMSEFTNSTGGGTFSVSDSGNNLYLNFTPVPEPSTWALIGIGVAAVAGFSFRRLRRSQRA